MLIGSAVMMVWPLPIIVPLAVGISAFVAWNVVRNLKKVMLVFLQSAPSGFDAEEFERQVLEIPGVVGVHHTRTWTLDGERHVFSTHLVLRRESGREEIMAVNQRVHELLRERDFEHISIKVELEGEKCTAEHGGHG